MPVKKENTYQCCHCGKSLVMNTNFSKSASDFYMGTTRLPVCRSCLDDLLDIYTEKYRDLRLGMQRLCMAFDLYYSEILFTTCEKDRRTFIGSYIKGLNMIQYKGKTFDTNLQEGFTFKKETKKKEEADKPKFREEKKADPKDVERWGEGMSVTDYDNLNSHYKYLKNANPNCDNNQEIFIVDLCYIKMQQMRAIKADRSDDYSKMAEQYRKTFSAAGLKTVRDSSADEDFSLGINIEMIEKYTPAEYYKNKNLHKDHDNIGDYFERFCLRPLRNLMHGTSDRDFEFYVKDEEENEFTDE